MKRTRPARSLQMQWTRGGVFESVSHRPASITACNRRRCASSTQLRSRGRSRVEASLARIRSSGSRFRSHGLGTPTGPPPRSTRSPTPAAPDQLFAGASRSAGSIRSSRGSCCCTTGAAPSERPRSRGRSTFAVDRLTVDRAERGPHRQAVRPSIGAAVLTDKGIDLRRRVEGALATLPTNERPRGIAWGIRATRGWDD